MHIDPYIYHELEASLQLEIERFCELLPEGDIEAIEHYRNRAEIEMAFESLGLSLMQNQIHPPDESIKALLKLGLQLNLDKESVFDDQFWDHFMLFLQNNCS